MKTDLANKAIQHMNNHLKKYCTNEEYNFFENQIKEFDTDLTGFGFYAIQAKIKLKEIIKLDFTGFRAVMLAYFNKDI